MPIRRLRKAIPGVPKRVVKKMVAEMNEFIRQVEVGEAEKPTVEEPADVWCSGCQAFHPKHRTR